MATVIARSLQAERPCRRDVIALVVLLFFCRTERGLRTMFQLWLCVALALLFFDCIDRARGLQPRTIGWLTGRLEASAGKFRRFRLVYARELERLLNRVGAMALREASNRRLSRISPRKARQRLQAAEMGRNGENGSQKRRRSSAASGTTGFTAMNRLLPAFCAREHFSSICSGGHAAGRRRFRKRACANDGSIRSCGAGLNTPGQGVHWTCCVAHAYSDEDGRTVRSAATS